MTKFAFHGNLKTIESLQPIRINLCYLKLRLLISNMVLYSLKYSHNSMTLFAKL